MASLGKWWARLGAVVGAVSLTVFVPVAAWASSPSGEIVLEAARRRRGMGAGFFGLVCCLVVVGAAVLLLVLLLRRRRSGRQ
jgi:Na+/melibiose symporter-like transporter